MVLVLLHATIAMLKIRRSEDEGVALVAISGRIETTYCRNCDGVSTPRPKAQGWRSIWMR